MADIDFDEIKENLKKVFSVDNLYKYRYLIIAFILVAVPFIVYYSTAFSKTNSLVYDQSSELKTYEQENGEEKFFVEMYDPISRDLNETTGHRSIYYNISYQKISENYYLQPDSAYWVHISNISLRLYIRQSDTTSWSEVFIGLKSPDATLNFGEYTDGSFDFSSTIIDEISNGNYTLFKIQLILNLTHSNDYNYGNSEFSAYGTIIIDEDLFDLNYDTGKSFALMVVVYYMVFFGLISIGALLYIKKKRISWISTT